LKGKIVAGGVVLLFFGILFVAGTVGAWLYLSSYCSGSHPSTYGAASPNYNFCLAFFTAGQLNFGGLASVGMPFVFDAVLALGFILVISGIALIILGSIKSDKKTASVG
jgi:hypothetical protein